MASSEDVAALAAAIGGASVSGGAPAAAAAASSSAASTSAADGGKKQPTAVIVIGMAGSGKTTLMQRLNAYLHGTSTPYYLLNLDPAVIETPFGANVDIRDTVNYKEVMKQYQLGPNGGILTALNLFATRFEQVMELVEKRADSLKYVLLDTPGQIEIFTWSASGQIITESLAASLPTVIVYVVDSARCTSPVTFMSNMLYACSILYKMKLPLVLAFNKTDVSPCETMLKWMTDLDSFTEALSTEKSYMGSLSQSMALMLEEFYNSLAAVGVSALTGDGMPQFFKAVDAAAEEYHATYKPELEAVQEARRQKEKDRQQRALEKMRDDGLEAAGAKVMLDGNSADGGGADGADGGGDGGADDDDDDDEGGGGLGGRGGYNAADEAYAMANPEEADEKSEYESLMRYLKQTREKREGAPP